MLAQAAELLATVTGQDLDQDAAGVFKIARRVAPDRVISTVDPDARHGHKTSARGFDGYKGHIAADPDSEIITATGVTPGNSGDAEAAEDLLADTLPGTGTSDGTQAGAAGRTGSGGAGSAGTPPRPGPGPPRQAPARPQSTVMPPTAPANCSNAWKMPASTPASRCSRPPR
jgi:hypothetical protein